MQDVFTLKNGVTMPRIGFGTYNTSDDEACRVVCDAVEVGYRLIDTAAIYENEAGIGRALATCGVPREELFITSKVWNTHRGYDKTMESFNASCERLGVDYLDLFLITGPRTKSSSAPRLKRSTRIPGALSRISTRTAMCVRSGFRTSNRITSKRS